MGYTHYWYTAPILELSKWDAYCVDAKHVIHIAREMGLKLAGSIGAGEPEITGEYLGLNGAADCGHAKDESIVIPWPSPTAGGIGTGEEAKAGSWYAGTTLNTRTCNGDCSYESFYLPRTWRPGRDATHDSEGGYLILGEDGKRFAFCKTAYRPYDVVVTALLILAKRHFGEAIRIASDGEDRDWEDGRILAAVACGDWAQYFRLKPSPCADGEELTELPRGVRHGSSAQDRQDVL